jgi:CheY-like chemotaxis protein
MTMISVRPGTARSDVVGAAAPAVAPQQRAPHCWSLRPFCELVEDQLAAIAAFQRDRRAAEAFVDAPGQSREQRLDARRRLDVLRRQHEALLAATAQTMDGSGGVLRAVGPRALLIHRNEWLRRRVAQDLARCGVEVIAQLDNGADGVGTLVAEQPDVLFVEDTLPMVGGLQVLAEARRYAPRTLLAVQVGYDDQLPAAFEAGAVAAFTRRIPPADIGAELARLVTA